MPRARTDLTGRRFGRWIAVRYVGGSWLCRCDCGNERNVATCSLTSERSTSCGCRGAEVTAARNRANPIPAVPVQDMTGESFSRLVVVRYVKGGKWECRCSCGATTVVRGVHLRSGVIRSCGCYRYDRAVISGELLRVPTGIKRANERVRCTRYRRTKRFDATRATYEASEAGKRTRRRWYRSEKAKAAARRRRAIITGIGGTLTDRQWVAAVELWGCCAYCGDATAAATQDHIVPITSGGAHDIWNVVPACRACNSSKHTADAEQFLMRKSRNAAAFWSKVQEVALAIEVAEAA